MNSHSSLRIAFVACNRNRNSYRQDPSFTYRCENLGLGLSHLGHEVSHQHIKAYSTKNRHDIVIFHRPSASLRLWSILRSLRRMGVLAVADFDDLVFDKSYASASPGVLNNLVSLRTTRRRFQSHQLAMSWFDAICVSTQPLARHVLKLFPHKQIQVIHNCVHRSWRDSPVFTGPTKKEKVITYFPGTKSHDRDFAEVQQSLSGFLAAHPEIQLQITGKLSFELSANSGQIRYEDKVTFSEYPKKVRASWVNIAPLENTPFNACKSALKIMETSCWGIPTICSPNADNERFVNAGALIADTPEQWLTHLEGMLDESRYNLVCAQVLDQSLALSNVDDQARQLLEFAAAQKNLEV